VTIDWLTANELERLLIGYPPIGIHLRVFFQGRISQDLAALIPHSPEPHGAPGLGPVSVWAGTLQGVPFTITSQPARGSWGFEVALPVRIKGPDIDLCLLQTIRALPEAIRHCDRPYFDSLPYAGDGFGVVSRGGDTPIFTARLRDNAKQVADFLQEGHPDGYETIEYPSASPQWLVAGPLSGSYLSRLEVTSSEEEALRLAALWTEETGARFEVHEQQLPAP
jgi:hypothetical protein